MPHKHTSQGQAGYPQVGWFLYLLHSRTLNRTYVGSTTDPARRLRQHRREIVGGACATSATSDWVMVAYLSGFQTRGEACRWEKIVKSRAVGIDSRLGAMILIAEGHCPRYKKRKQYPVPTGLQLIWSNTYVPSSVTN